MHAGLDRVVLGGQAERVVAHRVQHAAPQAAVEVGDRVAERVALEVADVRLAARVGEHLEHVGARRLASRARRSAASPVLVVHDLPGALLGPHALPARLDLVRVVAVLGHRDRRLAGAFARKGGAAAAAPAAHRARAAGSS